MRLKKTLFSVENDKTFAVETFHNLLKFGCNKDTVRFCLTGSCDEKADRQSVAPVHTAQLRQGYHMRIEAVTNEDETNSSLVFVFEVVYT